MTRGVRALGAGVALAALLLPGSEGRARAGDPPAGAPPAPVSAAGRSPWANLFPFGVRLEARPERRPKDPCAKAVTRALAYLAAHQTPDGGWKAAELGWVDGSKRHENLAGAGKPLYDVGITGLVLSTFFAAGYAPGDDSIYAPLLAKGVESLLSRQRADGLIGNETGMHYIYCHGFATLALVEAFGITGDPRLREPTTRALGFSAGARNPDLGWRYGVKPGDNDTSTTGCVFAAFHAAALVNESAEAAGVERPLPFDGSVYGGVRAWLDRMTGPYGRTGYLQRGGAPARPMELIDVYPADRSESCTAIALFLRQSLPGAVSEAERTLREKETKILLDVPPHWAPKEGTNDLYYWYYGSLALEAVGGDAWATWSEALGEALLPSQRTDTSVGVYEGSWDPDCVWGPDGGRLYSTAMATLCLLAPWRFPALPPGREDLGQALSGEGRSPAEAALLLDAMGRYGLAATDLVLDWIDAEDPALRVAALSSIGDEALDRAQCLRVAARLRDPALPVRRAAAEALFRVPSTGKGVADALVSALAGAEDLPLRLAVLRALGHQGAKAAGAVDRILPLLAGDAEPVRVAAAAALLGVDPTRPEPEPVLLAGLGSREAPVRREAATALSRLATPTPAETAALEKALDDGEVGVRIAAATGLAGRGAPAARLQEVAEAGLTAPQRETRLAALALLRRLGPVAASASPAVVPLALAGAREVRMAALETLAGLGPAAPGARAALYATTIARPPDVAARAETLLASLPASDPAVLPSLGEALGSDVSALRAGAALGLSAAGKAALPELRRRLGPGDGAVRGALRVLARLGQDALAAEPDVLALLARTDAVDVKALALHALGRMEARSREALDGATTAATASGNLLLQLAAVDALGGIASRQPTAVATLVELAQKTDGSARRVRIAALRTLASLGEDAADAAIPAYLSGFEAKEEDVREASIAGMATTGKAGVATLRDTIADPRERTRSAALETITSMGEAAKKLVPDLAKQMRETQVGTARDYAGALAGIGKPAVHELTRQLRDDSAYVRAAAAWALGRIGPAARSALSTLRSLLKDKDPFVRQEAARAMKLLR